MNSIRILHVLSAKEGKQSALYVNGAEFENTREEMSEIVRLEFLAGKHGSPWCGIVGGYYFVKGFFDNKDESGNEMTFSYCTKAKTTRELKVLLITDLNTCGYRMNATTSQCVNRKLGSMTQWITIAAIAIIIIILLTIFH